MVWFETLAPVLDKAGADQTSPSNGTELRARSDHESGSAGGKSTAVPATWLK